MNKKLTINRLALGNLKARKKQYATMIIGIILAMVFSSTMIFFLSSMASSMNEYTKNTVGNQDALIESVSESDCKDALEQGIISDYGLAHTIGFGYKEEKNRGFSIAWLDDKCKKISYISFIEGKYPENEGEIAVEKAELTKLGRDIKIGDTVTLNVLTQNGDTLSEKAVSKEYKLVGIARNKLSNSEDPRESVPSAFVCKNTDTEVGGKENLVAYINYDTNAKNQNASYVGANVMDFFSKRMNGGNGLQQWIFMNRQEGKYLFFRSDSLTFFSVAIVFQFILLIASAIIIVNAFNSNLKDRKKQIGMLRTVGATKRNIIKIYGREALIIALISTPVSLLISYIAVKIIISHMGENYAFVPNFAVLAGCGVFGIISVMLAALIPLIKASKTSPMQSIRNVNLAYKMKKRNIKSQKEFDVSTLLSKRSLMFSKGSQVAICVVLAITIIASSYCFSFAKFQFEQNVFNVDYYDYIISSSIYYRSFYNEPQMRDGYTDNEMYEISNHPYVKNVSGFKYCRALIRTPQFDEYMKTCLFEIQDMVYNDNFDYSELDKENLDKVFSGEYNDFYKNDVIEKNNFDTDVFPTTISAYTPDILKALEKKLVSGKIDIQKLNAGKEIIIVAPKEIAFIYEEDGCFRIDSDKAIDDNLNYLIKASCPYKVGDEIDLSVLTSDTNIFSDTNDSDDFVSKRTDKTVKIGAIVSGDSEEMAWLGSVGNGASNIMSLITSVAGAEKITPNLYYSSISMTLNREVDDDVDEAMEEFLSAYTNLNDGYYASEYSKSSKDKTNYTIMLVIMLAVLIIFISIAASIINNSLTARIRENKREMGTLRAVGADEGVLVKSYIKQLISMLSLGSIIGFVGFFVSYAAISIYCYKSFNDWNFLELKLEILPAVIPCLILFAICAFNLWSKIRKEMKNSIIDNIREL